MDGISDRIASVGERCSHYRHVADLRGESTGEKDGGNIREGELLNYFFRCGLVDICN